MHYQGTDLLQAGAGSSVWSTWGRFIAPRSCSSTARPGGTRMQSLGGQEPLVSDQIRQLRCYKKEGKEIKGFSMLEKAYWCWLLQLCSPRRVQQAIFPILASTAPASLPLAKMDVLRRNQHNSCPGKAGLASHCTNALSSLLFLFSESREMESWHCGIKSNSQEAGWLSAQVKILGDTQLFSPILLWIYWQSTLLLWLSFSVCTLKVTCISGKASSLLLAKPTGNPAPAQHIQIIYFSSKVTANFWSPWANTS